MEKSPVSRIGRLGLVAFALLLALIVTRTPRVRAMSHASQDWNEGGITWMPYAEGLAQAKQSHRPICLVFSTTWCPHCANYAKVFNDPQVVSKAKSFVMIRLDNDKSPELSRRYSPDGQYIPRTFFLTPDGQLDESLNAGQPRYRYFYNESEPSSLLAGMDRALAKLL